jgi:hypothetical protein
MQLTTAAAAVLPPASEQNIIQHQNPNYYYFRILSTPTTASSLEAANSTTNLHPLRHKTKSVQIHKPTTNRNPMPLLGERDNLLQYMRSSTPQRNTEEDMANLSTGSLSIGLLTSRDFREVRSPKASPVFADHTDT